MLEVIGLSKKIKGKQIVKDVSFTVPTGSVFGMIGPNGAGKTTILRMITGLIRPTDGKVIINGKNVQTDFMSAIADVGICSESPGFYNEFNAVQNLSITAQILGIDHSKVAEVIERVGLGPHKFETVGKYSLGMKQRLGIANAILANPKLLILDEPTNGLDAQGIIEIRTLVNKLKEQGLTILLCSHLLTEVEKVCDEIMILKNGSKVVSNALRHIELMNSTLEYKIKVTPLNDEVIALIKAVKSVTSIQQIGEDIYVTLDEDVMHKVVKTLVMHQYGVFEVEKVKQNLEDIFMSYVGGVQHV